jgi:hypothetical protein
MTDCIKQCEIGHIITYDDLMSFIGEKDKHTAIRVFYAAARRLEVNYSIFFRNRHKEGYERVSPEDSLEVCKTQIDFGLRRVKRGVERTYSIDKKELSDNRLAEVINIQSSFGRLQLMHDTGQ